MIQYVFHEPTKYAFKGRDGHDGKFFGTNSPLTQHLIIECNDKLTVQLTQQASEFNYYIIEGNGYFVLNGERQEVTRYDLVVVTPGTKYTFGGTLKMLLISTPKWTAEQEIVEKLEDM